MQWLLKIFSPKRGEATASPSSIPLAPPHSIANRHSTQRNTQEYWIRGEAQRNSDGTRRQGIIKRLAQGDPVDLMREPNNPHDPNAVAIQSRQGKIGYIAREEAAEVSERLLLGELAQARVSRILGGTRDKPSLGVVVAVDWLRDFHLLQKRLQEMEASGQYDALYLHFALTDVKELAYSNREEDPDALPSAIDLCRRQIGLSDKAARAFKSKFHRNSLPSHTGFRQLCIILERHGELDEAIRLATEAKKQGWDGDWDRRIARCEQKKLKPVKAIPRSTPSEDDQSD